MSLAPIAAKAAIVHHRGWLKSDGAVPSTSIGVDLDVQKPARVGRVITTWCSLLASYDAANVPTDEQLEDTDDDAMLQALGYDTVHTRSRFRDRLRIGRATCDAVLQSHATQEAMLALQPLAPNQGPSEALLFRPRRNGTQQPMQCHGE